jgi:hypothetical protein
MGLSVVEGPHSTTSRSALRLRLDHTTRMYDPYFVGFELLEGFLFVLCVRHASRTGWSAVGSLAAGAAFGMLVEIINLQLTHAYQYGSFAVTILDVPVAVGLAWGNQLYAARLLSDATSLPKWSRPILEALLIICIDLLVEPVATGLRFWTFRGATGANWFGTPLSNFWAFFWVVFAFSSCLRILEERHWQHWRWVAAPAALAACLAPLALLSDRGWFTDSGATRDGAVLSLLAASLVLMALLRPRPVYAPPAVAWHVLWWSELYFLGIGLASGTLLHPVSLLAVSLAVVGITGAAFSGTRRIQMAPSPQGAGLAGRR